MILNCTFDNDLEGQRAAGWRYLETGGSIVVTAPDGAVGQAMKLTTAGNTNVDCLLERDFAKGITGEFVISGRVMAEDMNANKQPFVTKSSDGKFFSGCVFDKDG